jgi:hypothetical protein
VTNNQPSKEIAICCHTPNKRRTHTSVSCHPWFLHHWHEWHGPIRHLPLYHHSSFIGEWVESWQRHHPIR